MNTSKILKISIIFLFGFLSANLVGLYFVYGFEVPVSFNSLSPFSFIFNSNSAPFDFVDESEIQIYNDRVVINIDGASISRYAPTGSMKPVLDAGANGIRIVPESEEDIHIGDIISFRQDSYLIVHRVVDKGTDEKGVYFITKGDNNNITDGKIRFEDIEFVTIAVVW